MQINLRVVREQDSKKNFKSSKTVVLNLWYAYHQWYVKGRPVVCEETTKVLLIIRLHKQ